MWSVPLHRLPVHSLQTVSMPSTTSICCELIESPYGATSDDEIVLPTDEDGNPLALTPAILLTQEEVARYERVHAQLLESQRELMRAHERDARLNLDLESAQRSLDQTKMDLARLQAEHERLKRDKRQAKKKYATTSIGIWQQSPRDWSV